MIGMGTPRKKSRSDLTMGLLGRQTGRVMYT